MHNLTNLKYENYVTNYILFLEPKSNVFFILNIINKQFFSFFIQQKNQ